MTQFSPSLEIEHADRFESDPPYKVAWQARSGRADSTEGAEDVLTATVWEIGPGHFAPGYTLESGGALIFTHLSEDDLESASMTADFCTGWASGSAN